LTDHNRSERARRHLRRWRRARSVSSYRHVRPRVARRRRL